MFQKASSDISSLYVIPLLFFTEQKRKLTDARFDIDNDEDISNIAENIQKQLFEKDSVSLFHMELSLIFQ